VQGWNAARGCASTTCTAMVLEFGLEAAARVSCGDVYGIC
jgi:hypothetical protein